MKVLGWRIRQRRDDGIDGALFCARLWSSLLKLGHVQFRLIADDGAVVHNPSQLPLFRLPLGYALWTSAVSFSYSSLFVLKRSG